MKNNKGNKGHTGRLWGSFACSCSVTTPQTAAMSVQKQANRSCEQNGFEPFSSKHETLPFLFTVNGIQTVFHAASILEIETVSLQYILLTTRTNCHNDLHFLGDGATRHDEGGSHAIRSAFVPALCWAFGHWPRFYWRVPLASPLGS